MKKIRFGMIVLWMLLCSVVTASAQVSIGIGLPNVSIGINLPLYPTLVPVPGYPVYYAPQVDANYFFYDGMYWVFYNDYWYASSWYNGPWAIVQPEYVPLFILRIPVHYYRRPPMYFHGWRSNAPPHWGEHWGPGWEQHRRGWDRWNRHYVPARAPLPAYQRRYSGDRYPHVQQQQTLRSRNYRYQPHDAIVRQHFKQQGAPAPAQRGRQEAPPARSPGQQEIQRSAPPQQVGPSGPHAQPTHRGGEGYQRPAPVQPPPQQQGPAPQQRGPAPQQRGPAPQQQMQQPPRTQAPEQRSPEPRQGHGQGPQKDEQRGKEHNK